MDSSERRPKRVFFLTDDRKTVEGVSEPLAPEGIEIHRLFDLDSMDPAPGTGTGTVLVMDAGALPEGKDFAFMLSRADGLLGGRPVLVCIAQTGDVDSRLQALRAGAAAFYVSPVAIEDLSMRLLHLSGTPSAPYRVLVVDDQPVAALFAARVLERAGMRTRIVGDSLRVLDALETLRPDLVLMDLHMPGADGIELTTLIREHDALFATPVVFLSSEMDVELQIDALRVGGDDFVAKPVRADHLVESVRRCILSSRSRGRQGAGRDCGGLQRIICRSDFLKRLDSAIARGIPQKSGWGVLMIELRGPERDPKGIGKRAIDALFGRLSGLLRRHLHSPEYATRYRDNGFAVMAERESEGDLRGLARALRSALVKDAGPGAFRVSIGIGLFRPPADDALTVISRAEKACSLGRDDALGIGIYSPLVPAGGDSERDAHLIAMIGEALRSEGFHLMYQPIMALRRRGGERYETRLRLKDRDGEYVPVFDFLRAARSGGLMPAIDRWVLVRALDVLREQRNAHRHLRFFIHQRLESLREGDWLPWFRDQIAERDLIRQRPVLQFQQEDLAANRELASVRIRELGRLGIKACVDHAEDDPQALDLFAELDVSMIRLNLGTIAAMKASHLTELVGRIHALGASVIVAGIEHPQTIAHVWCCGVDFVQGNFLQLPSEELSFDFRELALT
jgi:EAL domain-containing protein (putative c-di-GMP-specific phosphodiesterase class I)/PleD family two-component response regulator